MSPQGLDRPVKTSSWSGSWYAEADHDAFATTHAQEEEYATDLAAYKLTIQDKNPDEFKELVETYADKHPLNK